ncbi:MAG TPA: type II secretion system protein GspN [Polyangiales bacterium]|nr:type II secretion system protein GspN [Polyangiales bacterium]
MAEAAAGTAATGSSPVSKGVAFVRDYLGIGVLYVVFFVVAFMLAAYLTFPYDRLRGYILDKIEASTKGRPDAFHVELGELSPSLLTGVVLTDVDVRRRAADSASEAEQTTLHFDEVTARVSLWSLLMRAPKVNFTAKVGEGELEGSYKQDGDAQEIESEIDSLDVGKLGLGTFIGVPLKGRATGTLQLSMPAEAQKTTGDVELKISGLRIGDGKAKLVMPGLRSGMTLEEVDAGSLDLAIKAANGSAELVRFATDGKDLKIHGDGSIRLANPMRRSRPDVQLEMKLSDAYKQKTDRTKALFEILAMQPDWQRATGTDGSLNLHVTGTLQTPRATPGGTLRTPRKH